MPMASDEKQNGFRGVVKEVIDQILPSGEVELTDIKEEIWTDLAALYYKYEDEDQKRAFRQMGLGLQETIPSGAKGEALLALVLVPKVRALGVRSKKRNITFQIGSTEGYRTQSTESCRMRRPRIPLPIR